MKSQNRNSNPDSNANNEKSSVVSIAGPCGVMGGGHVPLPKNYWLHGGGARAPNFGQDS